MNIWQLQDLREMNDKTNDKVDKLIKEQEKLNKNLDEIKKMLDSLVESKQLKAETRDIGKS